jgi:hypothetical protein
MHDTQSESTARSSKVLRSLAKGLELAFWSVLVTSLVALAVHLCVRSARQTVREDDDSIITHFDLRRNIAMSMGGATGNPAPAPETAPKPTPDKWSILLPVSSGGDSETDFLSNVAVSQKGNVLHYRILIGPYDPTLDSHLKNSTGWVTLQLLQPNGRPIPTLQGGIKIEIASFDPLFQHGKGMGWVHAGSLRVPGLPSYKSCRFSLGWVLPEGIHPEMGDPIDTRGVSRF